MLWRSVVAAFCVLCITGMAQAAVISSVETDKAPNGGIPGDPYNPTFPSGGPSSVDLLEGDLPTNSSPVTTFQLENSTGVAALTNGTVATFYGTGTAASDHSAYATAGQDANAGKFVEYGLGAKYDLSSIVVYGGWPDGGRDRQHYDVLTSTDGTNFSPLGSIDVNPGIQGTDTGPISTRVAFTEDTLPKLATGVSHLRINFLDTENGWSGYTEVDVFGMVVPEPASVVLLGAGLLGVFVMRLRR